jgi:hypothetical protein
MAAEHCTEPIPRDSAEVLLHNCLLGMSNCSAPKKQKQAAADKNMMMEPAFLTSKKT